MTTDPAAARARRQQVLGWAAARGQMLHPPEDIAGVGHFSVVADPHGMAFARVAPER